MTILAVFRSRSETLAFLSVLKTGGVPAQAVNTPHEANVGCGLSVQFDRTALGRARYFLERGRYASFAGFLKRTGMTYIRL